MERCGEQKEHPKRGEQTKSSNIKEVSQDDEECNIVAHENDIHYDGNKDEDTK